MSLYSPSYLALHSLTSRSSSAHLPYLTFSVFSCTSLNVPSAAHQPSYSLSLVQVGRSTLTVFTHLIQSILRRSISTIRLSNLALFHHTAPSYPRRRLTIVSSTTSAQEQTSNKILPSFKPNIDSYGSKGMYYLRL